METGAREQCSHSERVYCESYVISLSKSDAAIAMGSQSETPNVIGWQVYQRPHVQGYINEMLDAATSSAKETLKLISDTQRANLSNYLVPVKKWHTPSVKKELAQLIRETRLYIQCEEDYCQAKGLTEKAFDKFEAELELYRDRILRWQIELKYNPLATRIVDGEPIEVETMELDLVALSRDKERGVIKTFKHTPQGIHVEICDPDTSKEKMSKVHGLYEKDNTRNINVNLADEPVVFK